MDDDEVEVTEEILSFHSNVRENIVSCLIIIFYLNFPLINIGSNRSYVCRYFDFDLKFPIFDNRPRQI